jgi:hypothetical protein
MEETEKMEKDAPLPKKNRVPLISECLFDMTCSVLAIAGGPQKNTPTSDSGCFSPIDEKILSQLGRPKCVGARREVMASFSAPTS